jgi:hypothetical protein
MPQQVLQGHHVHAHLQQVGGVAVPQGVQADALAPAQGPHRPRHPPLQGRDAPVPAGPGAGEEPVARPAAPPVGPQLLQQLRRQRHLPVLAPFTLAHQQQAAAAVDVRHAQADDLADAQAAGVGGADHQAVGVGREGREELQDLVAAEDGRQGLGPLAEGDGRDHVGAAEADAVEEAQGADGLVEGAPGGAAHLEQVELVGADVVGAELVGGPAEVAGEAGHVLDVAGDGLGGVVAELEVLQQALAQRGHGGKAPGFGAGTGGDGATMPRKRPGRKSEEPANPDEPDSPEGRRKGCE